MKRPISISPRDEPRNVEALLVSTPNKASILGRDNALPLESLGIAVLANILASEDFNVAVCDGDHQDLDLEMTRQAVLACEASFVGFTTYMETMHDVLELARAYKSRYPNAVICLGGYQATFCGEEILRHEGFVDLVVSGRSEAVIGELVREAQQGLRGRRVVSGAQELPRSITEPKTRWAHRDHELTTNRGSAALVASEGCFATCSFCATPQFERLHRGPRWKPRSVDDVLAEIDWLHHEFGVGHIHFHDPDFLGMTPAAHERALALAEGLKSLPYDLRVRFTAQARAAATTAEGFWATWRQAGLERVFIGLESGDDTSLRRLGKWSRAEHNIQAMRAIRSEGIALQMGFILLTPDQSIEGIREGLRFLDRIDQVHNFKHVSNPLRVYPGTADFDRLDGQGQLHYERRYLPTRYEYADPDVESLARHVLRVRGEANRVDRLLYDLEFGIAGRWARVQTDFGWIDGREAGAAFDPLRAARRQLVLESFEQALADDPGSAFDRFLEADRHLFHEARGWLAKARVMKDTG